MTQAEAYDAKRHAESTQRLIVLHHEFLVEALAKLPSFPFLDCNPYIQRAADHARMCWSYALDLERSQSR